MRASGREDRQSLLTSEGLHAERPIAHRLDLLIDLLPDENPFKSKLRPLDALTAYATTFRYPTPGGRIPQEPREADPRNALQITRTALTAAAEAFDVGLNLASDTPAERTTPPRRR